MRAILLRLAVAVLVLAALVEVMRHRERRCRGCNVILISADALRADHLGCYGYGRETSPAVDQLARQSLLFANAYSGSAWTLPGHMTMLTGRYAVRESEFVFMSGRPFPADYVSLPQLLQRAGYATAGFSGGGFVGDGMGFGRGFDTYSGRPEHLRGREDAVGAWLSRRDPRRPFFLFLHGYDVHEPYAPPADVRLRFIEEVPAECRGVDLRCNQADLACRQSPRGREYLVSQYDAEILGIDRFVGWLMGELKRLRLHKRTIVAFTADHGENLMENGDLGCGHMGTLDEPVFRVPLILHLPGAGPRRVEPRVSLVDLAPTLLHLLGIPRLDSMHGASLVPLLEGRARQRQINGLTGNDPGNVVLATIVGHEKVIKWRWKSGSPWIHELYDLTRDPHARKNLLLEMGPPRPAFYTVLDRLESWQQAVGLELDGVAPQRLLPATVLDQLEALGYR